MTERLARAQPDIVYVALGCPRQERLIERIRPAAPNAWYLGVGISFSYLCGAVRRAPGWMRKSGLEWVFRLLQEPKRLGRRYLREDIPFALRLGAHAVRARWSATPVRLTPRAKRRHPSASARGE
jgi:N-acetylglucosaminyldiphosphoundecaprenol N-acetyl-beta-D-mannosaminyltransferase